MSKLVSLNGQPTVQSVKTTKGKLYQYHIDLENGGIWNILLRKQITTFRNQNGLALKMIFDQVQKLQREYLVFDGENVKMENGKPVFLEGKSEAELQKRWDELMKEEVNMIV